MNGVCINYLKIAGQLYSQDLFQTHLNNHPKFLTVEVPFFDTDVILESNGNS